MPWAMQILFVSVLEDTVQTVQFKGNASYSVFQHEFMIISVLTTTKFHFQYNTNKLFQIAAGVKGQSKRHLIPYPSSRLH